MTADRRVGRATAALVLVLTGGCVLGLWPGVGDPRVCPPTRGQQIVSLLNTTREREALPPLRVDLNLMEAAQAHAEDMARRGFIGHEGSDGSLPATRADRAEYDWIFIAENTSAGYSTAPATFAGWMASPAHRANNLHEEAEHVGVGYAENGDSELRVFWVALFGASADPPVTPPDGCHP